METGHVPIQKNAGTAAKKVMNKMTVKTITLILHAVSAEKKVAIRENVQTSLLIASTAKKKDTLKMTAQSQVKIQVDLQ